ncbi:hypothetical protein FB567DRAFT_321548 [Paraphoma chrysanthemicola]|uniref:F-box domain-containing protein n=1 Tax=Paraphoma chrysanthemicola TaxID=798071 RepID=A0A8K0VZP1_9PLEO|nr:hypothetical protein FB567DRAFT_321548 [Paraphoma chrysanthemicola]
MHSIWHIPELLLHILLHLPANDLSRCYHVSYYWRATLKNNLPAHRRALPDCSAPYPPNHTRKASPKRVLPKAIRDQAASIQAQEDQWCSLANFMDLGDDHFYWRESACEDLLERVKTYLHPWIAEHACVFVEGLDALAGGGMGVCVRTECTAKDLVELCESEDDGNRRNEWLTYPATRKVRLYCTKGAEWDLTNRSVIQRDGFTWRASSVKVEHEYGVRMGDVVDELRGVLVVDQEAMLDDVVMLEWRFKEDVIGS